MEEDNQQLLNLKPKAKNVGSKSANFQTMPTTEEIEFMKTMLISSNSKENQEQEENIVVLPNGTPTIDFMMPENEREIIEQNLNIYSDFQKMQKVLNIAKKNKKISEDIKSLGLITKAGDVSNTLLDVLNNPDNIKRLNQYIQRKFDEGDIAKAYKEVATAAKIMLDARDEMEKRLNTQNNKKNAKIALKFTNDNGDFQLGVDI